MTMASSERPASDRRASLEGRLLARPAPGPVKGRSAPAGLNPLGLTTGRDGRIYVPPSYSPDRPAPLVLVLHGAGGHAEGALEPFRPAADDAGLILLAPDSRFPTWDALIAGFGPDVAFIDRALESVFARYTIDPSRVAVAGSSDGASYALSLGLINGDLFTHVVALVPGFEADGERRGTPRLFIAHGTRDEVLPIDRCSRSIVPALRDAGYDVSYREFDGPHAVPPEIVLEALAWLGAS
jgi:predicted esterase